MSRKKKYKEALKTGVPSSSFMRVKSQLRRRRSRSFSLSKWANGTAQNGKGEPRKLFFPYAKRIKPALDLCGKYEILQPVPSALLHIALVGKKAKDNSEACKRFWNFISKITKKEFKEAKLSNQRLHELLDITGQKGKVKKARLMPIFDYFRSIGWVSEADYIKIKTCITRRGVKNAGTHIYLSADPWDIFRMGIGKKSFGSCMNTVNGAYSYCTRCPCNYADSNMLVAFAESDIDHRKHDGMLTRMVLRVLNTPDGYGAVLDRLYGQDTLRKTITTVVQDRCREIGINYLCFSSYMHNINHHRKWKASGKKIWGATNINHYKWDIPYLDNVHGGGGYQHVLANDPEWKAAVFKVVVGDRYEET